MADIAVESGTMRRTTLPGILSANAVDIVAIIIITTVTTTTPDMSEDIRITMAGVVVPLVMDVKRH